MSDDADRVQEQMEMMELIQAKHRKAPKLEANPTGSCLNCGMNVKSGRWCDIDCRDDWSRRQKR